MKLIKDDGSCITDAEEIRTETKLFFEKLYQKREIEQCEIDELVNDIPKLPVMVAEALEGEITIEEAGNVLKSMKNGKSPGTDGFTAEVFLEEIRVIYHKITQRGFQRWGTFTSSEGRTHYLYT